MKIKKTGKLLKKLNNLYENMKEEGDISRIEQDLFLSYIKDLYEQALDFDHDDEDDLAITSETPVSRTPREEKPRSAESAPVMPQVAVDQRSQPPVNEAVTNSPATTVVDDSDRAVSPAVVEQEPVPVPQVDEDLIALFVVDGVKEVSDRLGMTPIADMHRCMGINERIFTIRELFNGDDGLFSQTMTKLNSLASFEEATEYLQRGVASDLDWVESARSKKASNFVKLVYRRYL